MIEAPGQFVDGFNPLGMAPTTRLGWIGIGLDTAYSIYGVESKDALPYLRGYRAESASGWQALQVRKVWRVSSAQPAAKQRRGMDRSSNCAHRRLDARQPRVASRRGHCRPIHRPALSVGADLGEGVAVAVGAVRRWPGDLGAGLAGMVAGGVVAQFPCVPELTYGNYRSITTT